MLLSEMDIELLDAISRQDNAAHLLRAIQQSNSCRVRARFAMSCLATDLKQ